MEDISAAGPEIVLQARKYAKLQDKVLHGDSTSSWRTSNKGKGTKGKGGGWSEQDWHYDGKGKGKKGGRGKGKGKGWWNNQGSNPEGGNEGNKGKEKVSEK